MTENIIEALSLIRKAEALIRSEDHSYLADRLDDLVGEIILSIID